MQKTLDYNGTKVCYHVYGSGDAIVFVHGFGEDGSIFNDQVKFLEKNNKVIVPDLPGSGSSDLLRKNDPVTVDDYAEVIFQLFQNENITSCIMLGHSMGGYITLAFADKYPDHLKAFGLIHSSAAADTGEKKDSRRQGIKMINEYGPFPFLKNTIPGLFGDDFKKTKIDKVTELVNKSRQFTAETLIQYYNAMISRPDRFHVLENASVPVLFVIGKEDKAAPLNIVIDQVHIPKISVIQIADNVGHMIMAEAPEKLNAIIKQFVAVISC